MVAGSEASSRGQIAARIYPEAAWQFSVVDAAASPGRVPKHRVLWRDPIHFSLNGIGAEKLSKVLQSSATFRAVARFAANSSGH